MRVYARIIDVFAKVVTVAVILFLLVFMAPRVFGIEPFVVQSNSMEPVFNTYDVVFIDTNQTDVQIGDIVLQHVTSEDEQIDMNVTHRVISQNSDGTWVTKGDHNNSADIRPLTQENVVGIYVFHIPWIGHILQYQQLLMIPTIVVVIALNLMAYFAQKSLQINEEGRNETGKEREKEE